MIKRKGKRASKRAPRKINRAVTLRGKRRNYEAAIVVEDFGGRPYEYVPLGKYIVAARNVCGGRPTIKYHRLDARWILRFYNRGESVSRLAKEYEIPLAAVKEVIALADKYDYEKSYI
ncbi:MAG: DUF433 domain-containing protein [Chloracidobacterium sp.]|nr:DUF433 domain-containing protein [Chloracidobacterium sp.]